MGSKFANDQLKKVKVENNINKFGTPLKSYLEENMTKMNPPQITICYFL